MTTTKTRSVRIDAGTLNKAERTPQGFLRAPLFATRTGVFFYRNGDGSVRAELRHPEDVFSADSLASLRGVPVTNDHPNVTDPEVLLLTPETARRFMVGYVGDDVRADGDYVAAVATVMDAELIAAMESGKLEVSCGYSSEHEEAPGVYQGQAYDVRQRNILYNHLAVVDRGRAGPGARIRLDAADAVQCEKPILETATMEKITLGGVEFDVTPELKAAIEAGIAAAAAKTDEVPPPKDEPKDAPKDEEVKDLKEKLDAATGRADAAAAALAQLKAARVDAADPARVRALVKARRRVEAVAARTLPADELAKLDSMDDAAVKAAVIKAEFPAADLAGKSADYVNARFDGIADGLEGDLGDAALGAKLDADRKVDAVPDSEAARRRMMDRAQGKVAAK